jgi:hypothetical protein
MSIVYGRRHGNGYHGNVYQKITVKHSERFYDLLEYEINQMERNNGIIYERDFNPSWIARVCIRCSTLYPREYMELNERGVFECSRCHLIKVPTGVDYKSE